MSSDKNKMVVRMLLTLEGHSPGITRDGLYLNCLGGYGTKNPVIVKLIQLGYITVPGKDTPPKKFQKAFQRFFSPFGIHGHAPRLYSHVTDKGREFFEKNKHLIKPEMREPRWNYSLGEYIHTRRYFRKNSVYWY